MSARTQNGTSEEHINMTPLNHSIDKDDDNVNEKKTPLDNEAENPTFKEKQPDRQVYIEPTERSYVPNVDAADWSDDDFEDDGDDEETSNLNIVSKVVMAIQKCAKIVFAFLLKVTRGHLFALVFLLAYTAYFITAMCYEFGSEASHRLLACTIIGAIIILKNQIANGCKRLFWKMYGADHISTKHKEYMKKARFFLRWIMYGVLLAIVVYTLIDEGRRKPENLRSLPGLFFFMIVPIFFSSRPDKINWHIVYWSNGLQFLCAVFVLKWKTGRKSIVWIQDRFDEFFANADAGSKLLFGDNYREHYMIFGAIPIMFLTNAALTVMYYLGVMQFIIKTIGRFLNFVLGASRVECTSVSTGIFLEGVTTCLICKPFLKSLTKSQMFIILTCCLSSLGGAYLAILSGLGVSLKYLIPAMLVSAPATFAVSKVMVPETKKLKDEDDEALEACAQERRRYINIMDAAQTGAIAMLGVVGNLAVVAFAFFSFISWINHTLTWFGDRVGIDNLTIEYISSYLLYPVALAMGVEPEDCKRVAKLLGYRIGIYNVVAFIKLAEMKFNKFTYEQYILATNGTGPISHDRDDVILTLWNQTLPNGYLSDRSEAIITYCLCGFSSFCSVAMHLGILFALIPKRRVWLSKVAIPALVAGNLANCMTGCFASIFY